MPLVLDAVIIADDAVNVSNGDDVGIVAYIVLMLVMPCCC